MHPRYDAIPQQLVCPCCKTPFANGDVLAAAQTIHAQIIMLQRSEAPPSKQRRTRESVKKEA